MVPPRLGTFPVEVGVGVGSAVGVGAATVAVAAGTLVEVAVGAAVVGVGCAPGPHARMSVRSGTRMVANQECLCLWWKNLSMMVSFWSERLIICDYHGDQMFCQCFQ